jgi:hypothetical protein
LNTLAVNVGLMSGNAPKRGTASHRITIVVSGCLPHASGASIALISINTLIGLLDRLRNRALYISL